MKHLSLCITKSDFALKTFMADNSINIMKNRYASAVIIVLHGCITFEFAFSSVTLQSGNALFITEGADYTIYCHEAADSLVINFHAFSPDDASSVSLPSEPYTELGSINPHTAMQLFEHLNVLLQYPMEHHNEIFAIYYQLLSLFSNKKKLSEASEALVQEAEKLIWEHYASPSLSCNGIADTLHISEVYLRKLFLRYRQLPPSQYLIQIRMEKAKQFLLEGCSVSKTAENTGYSDIYQFSRAYKKYHGIAPSKHTV